jgi:hypothetical protein
MIPVGNKLLQNNADALQARLVNLDEVKEQFALMVGS